jgi:hypothetical protein
MGFIPTSTATPSYYSDIDPHLLIHYSIISGDEESDRTLKKWMMNVYVQLPKFLKFCKSTTKIYNEKTLKVTAPQETAPQQLATGAAAGCGKVEAVTKFVSN